MLKVAPRVAAPGAESAIYDCLVQFSKQERCDGVFRFHHHVQLQYEKSYEIMAIIFICNAHCDPFYAKMVL